MTRCLIHIGMEKTGSTSIQRLLRDNGAALRRAGVAYPLAGSDRANHNFLASAYIPLDSDRLSRGARSVRAARPPGFLDENRTAIMAEIGKHDRVVISGEHLFRLAASEVGALKRDLEAAGVRETRVFGVLRSPASFYLSFVQQELKGSATFPSPDTFFVPYSARAAGWLEHFDCAFLEFQTLIDSDLGIIGTFIQQLEQTLGVDLSALPRTVRDANDSMSPEEMQLVQDFRRQWFPDDDGLLNRPTTRLVGALRRYRGESWRKPILRPEVEARISERHRKDVEALAALTGVTLAVSPDDTPGGPIMAQQARDILANFDEALHRRLVTRVCSSRYLGFRTRFANLVKSLGGRAGRATPAV